MCELIVTGCNDWKTMASEEIVRIREIATKLRSERKYTRILKILFKKNVRGH